MSCCFTLVVAGVFAAGPGALTGTVYFTEDSRGSLRYVENRLDPTGAATATYAPGLNVSGWDKLWVQGLPNASPALARYGVGYLEGRLTQRSIHSMFLNTYADWFADAAVKRTHAIVYNWLEENWKWMKEEAATHTDSPFWDEVNLLIQQFEGLVEGYNAAAPAGEELRHSDFLLLNGDGDVEDVVNEIGQLHMKDLRCSSLFKLAADRSDIFFGHATWDHYSMMVRTLKSYRFEYQGGKKHEYTMSSSPGFLSSVDDFYLTSRGLAVIETTNGNFNQSLYSRVHTSSVLSWVRVTAANAIASTTSEWVQAFSMLNSGTYNNQWMVLDLKLFVPGKDLVPGTFVVLEQLPGYIEFHDESETLNSKGYWASYNVPAFEGVYNLSGFAEQTPKEQFSHSTCPRANIFRQRHNDVDSVESYKKLIRYNDYEHDPFSKHNACNAISARCDLNPESSPDYRLDGGIDAKVSNVKMGLALEFEAQNGPSFDQTPPFDWKDVPASAMLLHTGQPDRWEFGWVSHSPHPAEVLDALVFV